MAAARIVTMALAALTAALVAGCSLLPPPAGIQGTIPGDDWPDLPVTVVDRAGIVGSIAPGSGGIEPDVSLTGAVSAIPGRDDAVMLTWLGGECDDRSVITIDPVGTRYRVSIESPSTALGCSAVGIIRRLVLTLNRPAAPDAFETP